MRVNFPTIYTLLSHSAKKKKKKNIYIYIYIYSTVFSSLKCHLLFLFLFLFLFALQIASYVFLGLCVTCLVHSWVLFHLFILKLWYIFWPFCLYPYPFFFLLHAFFHSTHCPLPWPCPTGCCPTAYCLHSTLYTPIKEPFAYPLWQITSPFWVKVTLPYSHLTSLSLKW